MPSGRAATLPSSTDEILTKLWNAAYPSSLSSIIDHKLLSEALNEAEAVLADGEAFLLRQPSALSSKTMNQLALLKFLVNHLRVKYHHYSATSSSSSSQQQAQPITTIPNTNSSTTTTNNNSNNNNTQQTTTKQQKTDFAKDSIKSMNICRNYLGWVRSAKKTQISTSSTSTSSSSSPTSTSKTGALCLSTEVELYSANSHFQLRNYSNAYESLLSARSYLVQLTRACFPQHNGNPSTYLMYFLTVSLASIYHNLAVVAKHLQRYDASLMWILHFVRISELVENENSCEEVDDLKEPLLTRARIARQFIVPVLFGMVSAETNRTPQELVIRVRAIAESGKHKIDAKSSNTQDQHNIDNNNDNDDNNEVASSPGKKDVRIMAARLAAVQSFGERYFAGATLQEILSSSSSESSSSSLSVEKNATATTSQQQQSKPSRGFFASLFGSSSSSSSTSENQQESSRSNRRPAAAHKSLSSSSAIPRRINPIELIQSIIPGDSKEEIQSKLFTLSFPYIPETTRSSGKDSTSSSSSQKKTSSNNNNNRETEILRKVLYYSKFENTNTGKKDDDHHQSFYDSIIDSFSSSSSSNDDHQAEKKKYRGICEDVAASVASALTNGKIKTCDLTQLTPMMAPTPTDSTNNNNNDSSKTAATTVSPCANSSDTSSSAAAAMTQDQKEAQDLLFDVNTQLPGELRHLFFAGIDFASVGLEHTALVELVKFYLSERFDVICAAIEEDLNLLAVSLTSDSWGGNSSSSSSRNNNSGGAFSLLDFEAAMEVFCAEFDNMLMTPLILQELETAKALLLFETGSVPCFSSSASSAVSLSTTGNTNTNTTATSETHPAEQQEVEEKENKSSSASSSMAMIAALKIKLKDTYTPQLEGGSGGLLSDPFSRQVLHSQLPFYIQNYDWICKFSSRIHGSSFSKLYDKCLNCTPVLLLISARVANDDSRADSMSPQRSNSSNNNDNDNNSSNGNNNNNLYTTFGAFISGPLEPRPPGHKKSMGLSAYGESFVFREINIDNNDDASSSNNGMKSVECFQYNPDNSNPTTIVECSTERIQIGSSMMAPTATDDDESDDHDDKQNKDDSSERKSSSKNKSNNSKCFLDGGPSIYLPAFLKAGSTYSCETFNSPPLMKNLSSTSSFVPACIEVYGFG